MYIWNNVNNISADNKTSSGCKASECSTSTLGFHVPHARRALQYVSTVLYSMTVCWNSKRTKPNGKFEFYSPQAEQVIVLIHKH